MNVLSLLGVILFLQQQPLTAGIQGIVLRAGTGEPIAGARLIMLRTSSPAIPPPGTSSGPEPPLEATTNGQGRFAIPGQSVLPTYYPNAQDPAQASAIDVQYGGELTAVDFELERQQPRRIRGRVIDGAGQPPASATIFLVTRTATGGTSRSGGAQTWLPQVACSSCVMFHREITRSPLKSLLREFPRHRPFPRSSPEVEE